jgi:hypothetical protein
MQAMSVGSQSAVADWSVPGVMIEIPGKRSLLEKLFLTGLKAEIRGAEKRNPFVV